MQEKLNSRGLSELEDLNDFIKVIMFSMWADFDYFAVFKIYVKIKKTN